MKDGTPTAAAVQPHNDKRVLSTSWGASGSAATGWDTPNPVTPCGHTHLPTGSAWTQDPGRQNPFACCSLGTAAEVGRHGQEDASGND